MPQPSRHRTRTTSLDSGSLETTVTNLQHQIDSLQTEVARLAALPGSHTNSGLADGGLLTQGTGMLDVDVARGSGWIVTRQLTGKPAHQLVTWEAQTVTIVPAGFHDHTIVISDTGIASAIAGLEVGFVKDNLIIHIGTVNLTSLFADISNIINIPISYDATSEGFVDFLQATDQIAFAASGFAMTPVAAEQQLDLADGKAFILSANYRDDPNNPNFIDIPGEQPLTIDAQIDRNAVAANVGLQDISVHLYDNNGTIEVFGNDGGQSGRASIQRLFLAKDQLGAPLAVVQLAQQHYASLDQAINNLFSDVSSYNRYPGLDDATLVGFIISERGGTVTGPTSGVDFSDPLQTILVSNVSSSPTEAQILIGLALDTPFVQTGNKDPGVLDFDANRVIDESFPLGVLNFTLGAFVTHRTGHAIFCTVTVGPGASVTFGPEFTQLSGPPIVPNDRIAIRFQYHGANNEVFFETWKI